MKDTIVVAMSGGIDSAVTAALLCKQGFHVIGITMKLYKHDGGCCSISDINDAKQVAKQFDFTHQVIDYSSLFQDTVINQFVQSYTSGSTPLPCVRCNQDVKFDALLHATKLLGGKKLATGHYAQIKDNGIYCSVDASKDQTYYLFPIKSHDICNIAFPLGGYQKNEVRQMAYEMGIKIYNKKDSQDICFVTKDSYKEFIRRYVPIKSGDILDVDGKIIGQHNGITDYTIGQRRGINIGGAQKRQYVTKIVASKNQIFVGSKQDLEKNYVTLENFNQIEKIQIGDKLQFKFRANQSAINCTLLQSYNNKIILKIDQPDYSGIANGQAGVGYIADEFGNRMIGGGWISSSAKHYDDLEI